MPERKLKFPQKETERERTLFNFLGYLQIQNVMILKHKNTKNENKGKERMNE